MKSRIALLMRYEPETPSTGKPFSRSQSGCTGINRHESLVRHLARLDLFDLHVISETRRISQSEVRLAEQGMTFHFLRREPYNLAPYYLYATGVARIRRLLRTLTPDLVVGFGTDDPYGWEAFRSGYRTAVYVQGIMDRLAPHLSWPRAQLAAVRWMERQTLSGAAGIIVESQFARDWVMTLAPHGSVQMIPNCLRDVFAQSPNPPSQHSRDLWCVGELARHKNPALVLTAFAHAADPTAQLHFAGTGPLRNKLEKAAGQLGISSRCHFHGWLTPLDLALKLTTASALVLGSWVDTSPNVILEAHALGLPVIATAVGGIPSRLHHDVDGLLVPPGDADAMASAMQRIFTDPHAAARMGAAGRERVLQEHAPTHIAQLHAEFYQRLISAGKA